MPTTDQTPLRRGETLVTSLTGAFGASLRETRITAVLEYLIREKVRRMSQYDLKPLKSPGKE